MALSPSSACGSDACPIRGWTAKTLLGEGVSARVFSTHEDPAVVLKVFDCTRDFKKEAAAWPKLAGIPHVLRAVASCPQCITVVYPRFDMSLEDYILTHAQNVRVMQKVAFAMVEVCRRLVERGLYHDDMKAKNILLKWRASQGTPHTLADLDTLDDLDTFDLALCDFVDLRPENAKRGRHHRDGPPPRFLDQLGEWMPEEDYLEMYPC